MEFLQLYRKTAQWYQYLLFCSKSLSIVEYFLTTGKTLPTKPMPRKGSKSLHSNYRPSQLSQSLNTGICWLRMFSPLHPIKVKLTSCNTTVPWHLAFDLCGMVLLKKKELIIEASICHSYTGDHD